MMKLSMIVAVAAAAVFTAGAAVAKGPGTGGSLGASGTGPSQGKALGSGGWTTGNPPGFDNSGSGNDNFRKGWGEPSPGTPPGWNNMDNSRSWTPPGVPPGIGNHAPATTTVK